MGGCISAEDGGSHERSRKGGRRKSKRGGGDKKRKGGRKNSKERGGNRKPSRHVPPQCDADREELLRAASDTNGVMEFGVLSQGPNGAVNIAPAAPGAKKMDNSGLTGDSSDFFTAPGTLQAAAAEAAGASSQNKSGSGSARGPLSPMAHEASNPLRSPPEAVVNEPTPEPTLAPAQAIPPAASDDRVVDVASDHRAADGAEEDPYALRSAQEHPLEDPSPRQSPSPSQQRPPPRRKQTLTFGGGPAANASSDTLSHNERSGTPQGGEMKSINVAPSQTMSESTGRPPVTRRATAAGLGPAATSSDSAPALLSSASGDSLLPQEQQPAPSPPAYVDGSVEPPPTMRPSGSSAATLGGSVKAKSPGKARQRPQDALLVTIHGQQYNLAPLLPTHPGGQDILRQFRGRDATAVFTSSHNPQPLAALRKYEYRTGEL